MNTKCKSCVHWQHIIGGHGKCNSGKVFKTYTHAPLASVDEPGCSDGVWHWRPKFPSFVVFGPEYGCIHHLEKSMVSTRNLILADEWAQVLRGLEEIDDFPMLCPFCGAPPKVPHSIDCAMGEVLEFARVYLEGEA